MSTEETTVVLDPDLYFFLAEQAMVMGIAVEALIRQHLEKLARQLGYRQPLSNRNLADHLLDHLESQRSCADLYSLLPEYSPGAIRSSLAQLVQAGKVSKSGDRWSGGVRYIAC